MLSFLLLLWAYNPCAMFLLYYIYTRHHRFKYWHGIWTIVLLLYVMSVETSTSLLFCPTLNVKNCPEVESVSFHNSKVVDTLMKVD